MPRKTRPRRDWRRRGPDTSGYPRYSPEDIETIAAILGVSDSKAKKELQAEIEDVVARYLGLKRDIDKAPRPAEVRVSLDEVEGSADTLLEYLEELDEDTEFALQQAAAGKMDVVDKGIYSVDEETFRQGEMALDRIVQHIYNLLDNISSARSHVSEPRRGAPRKLAFTAYVWMLANVFNSFTGRRAAVTYDEKKGGHTGTFVEFVAKCLKPVEGKHSTNALGQKVKRALKKNP